MVKSMIVVAVPRMERDQTTKGILMLSMFWVLNFYTMTAYNLFEQALTCYKVDPVTMGSMTTCKETDQSLRQVFLLNKR